MQKFVKGLIYSFVFYSCGVLSVFSQSPPCTGTPEAGMAVATKSTICLGESVTVWLDNELWSSDLEYQWFASVNNGATYGPMVGSTNSFITVTPSQPTTYRARVKCQNSQSISYSTPVSIHFHTQINSVNDGFVCESGNATLSVGVNPGVEVK